MLRGTRTPRGRQGAGQEQARPVSEESPGARPPGGHTVPGPVWVSAQPGSPWASDNRAHGHAQGESPNCPGRRLEAGILRPSGLLGATGEPWSLDSLLGRTSGLRGVSWGCQPHEPQLSPGEPPGPPPRSSLRKGLNCLLGTHGHPPRQSPEPEHRSQGSPQGPTPEHGVLRASLGLDRRVRARVEPTGSGRSHEGPGWETGQLGLGWGAGLGCGCHLSHPPGLGRGTWDIGRVKEERWQEGWCRETHGVHGAPRPGLAGELLRVGLSTRPAPTSPGSGPVGVRGRVDRAPGPVPLPGEGPVPSLAHPRVRPLAGTCSWIHLPSSVPGRVGALECRRPPSEGREPDGGGEVPGDV
ncbi:collagen alpha-1(II) chain-like [Vulpes lagopus]|uniref:collagen alpha-1(II) chain-like n=1 Tax=Vulpes lagopus TaxID=494514 RepID=UPI001BC94FD8|nr:collagen alpha-1(II) chain-like [Vulpes lagopus]